jgi:hypothetical protein
LVGLLLVLGAYPLFWAQRIGTQGWIGAVPTSPLIWWVVRYEPPEAYRNGAMSKPTRYASELARRAGGGELAGWQWRWMLRGLGAIRAREVWPVGKPFVIETGIPHWLWSSVRKFEVASPFTDAERQWSERDMPWSIGRLPEGASGVTLKVTADRFPIRVSIPPSTLPPPVLWSGDWYIPVKQVKRVGDAITPVTSPEIDAAVRKAMYLGLHLDNNASTGTAWMLGIRFYRDKGPVPDDIVIALRVDLLFEGQVRDGWTLAPHDSIYGEPVDWVRINLPEQAMKDPGWTIRVRGDAAAALLDVTRPRCWTGEYSVPVSEFVLK